MGVRRREAFRKGRARVEAGSTTWAASAPRHSAAGATSHHRSVLAVCPMSMHHLFITTDFLFKGLFFFFNNLSLL